MKFIGITAILILTILCPFLNATSNSDEETKNVVDELLLRYNKTVKACYDENANVRPAYECAGIIIRGVNQEQKLPRAWSMKPLNKEKQSFSVAFLRKDQPFSKFPTNYDSGFIIYPPMKTPEKKSKIELFCAFPLDALTDERTDHGCGISDKDKEGKSKPCDKQGIDSLEKWIKFFNEIKSSGDKEIDSKLCSFDLTDVSSAVGNFNSCLEASEYLRRLNHSEYAFQNNEMKARSWEEEAVEKLPLEAFFYVLGSENGLEYAKKYQNDHSGQSNGERLPIVGIQLPSAESENLHVKLYTD